MEIQLPAIVPADYQLDVVAQRESGNDCLSFTFPIAGTSATLVVDGGEGKLSGLQTIDGKGFTANETTREAAIFADGKPHSINITVRKNHVRLYCDRKHLLDWAGDVSRLKASETPPYGDRIYLGHWHSRYRLTKINLRALRGDAADEAPPALAADTSSPPVEMPAPSTPRPPERKFADLGSGKETRLPVPDDEAQKEARKEMQKKFASDMNAAKTPAQKRTLAQEMTQKAVVDDKVGAYAYVLLKQAIDLAEAAGEIELAWQTIDQLANTFAVEGVALRNQSLAEIGKSAKSPAQAWQLTDAACRLLTAALVAGDAATVKKAASQAQSFARRTKDSALQKEVNSRATDAGKLAADLEAVTAARETLKTSPDDPQANFTVGHYELCAAGERQLTQAAKICWRPLCQGYVM
ncbi:MAG: hypothetical protein ACREHD_12535, partial [Pirellulales bacterium]